jgi:hypothetical protein
MIEGEKFFAYDEYSFGSQIRRLKFGAQEGVEDAHEGIRQH